MTYAELQTFWATRTPPRACLLGVDRAPRRGATRSKALADLLRGITTHAPVERNDPAHTFADSYLYEQG